MKILITQRKLDGFEGTELVTLELSRALTARGHEVAVYSPRGGRLTDLLAADRIVACRRLADIPFVPDVIHAHHQLPAMAAIAHFPQTPAIYMCHGARPWVEQAPQHPAIRAYVAVSDKLANRVATLLELPAGQAVPFKNYVDTSRFSRVREPQDGPPRRAVLFGQRGFSAEELQDLDQACAANGMTLDKMGAAYGNVRHHPELFLPDYDVAFAIGRSAVEAMACGCVTIPVVPLLGGQRITPTNLDDWAAINFSPRYFSGADRVSAKWLERQLSGLNSADVTALTARVRSEFSLSNAVDLLEDLYRRAVDTSDSIEGSDDAVVAYLERLATEVDELWETLQNERAGKEMAERQRDHLSDLLLDRLEIQGKEAHQSVEKAGFFDSGFYLDRYPDLAKSRVVRLSPLIHYIRFGAKEGREPTPGFGTGPGAVAPRRLGLTPFDELAHRIAYFEGLPRSSISKRLLKWVMRLRSTIA